MPKNKYEKIYEEIKRRIETFEYEYQQLLPSENSLVLEFSCSRNTIRRALQSLASEGYVQTLQGKGVRVLYQSEQPSLYMLGGIESFTEASKRNLISYETKVILFSELLVDKKINKRTGFEIGAKIYYIQRLRYLDGAPLIIDHNFFLADVVSNLTKDIANQSIYEYIEKELNITITTTKRIVTVEPVTELDETYLELDHCNCVAVISNSTYNSDGIMFEFTQSRHSPKHFEFHQVAQRLK